MAERRRFSNRIRSIRNPYSNSELSATNLMGGLDKDSFQVTPNILKTNSLISFTIKADSSAQVSNTSDRLSESHQSTSGKRTHPESIAFKPPGVKKSKESKIPSDTNVKEITVLESSIRKSDIEKCPICLDDCDDPKILSKCGHVFCRNCIDQYFEKVKPQCPCCSMIYGEIRGNQPENGTMMFQTSRHRLPGFEKNSSGTIRISYHFPDGIQNENHPNPGQPYKGTSRTAYLPENQEGRVILNLLKRAFELRQIFTVGQSRTTGYDNVITWNDIHHKTSYHGGVENFGYPDPTYLNRVRQELAAKGIV